MMVANAVCSEGIAATAFEATWPSLSRFPAWFTWSQIQPRDDSGDEGQPSLPVSHPEDGRNNWCRQEVRRIDQRRRRVVPLWGARVEQMLLQPHRGHRAAEQEPVGGGDVALVQWQSDPVRESPGHVIDHEHDREGQPIE
jgi:hypothetical protein